ncbi:acyltransferase [Embleya sp. NBC_00888]|uniref:acyltransferase family protein n=1 Tax=Embleya sp. NBC_00888 TaxID=2975960 RepID=UPI0038652252|nr:acyltransferase [Embleya sp. NBC_00888]
MTGIDSAKKQSTLPSLTGMRFFAALMVFLAHASDQRFFRDAGFSADFNDVVRGSGYVGVAFFFVLSGFVLTWSARAGDTARAFWRRRAAKVYPNTVVAVVLAAILLSTTDRVLEARVLIPNLLLIQSWIPDLEIFLGVNPPTWSLACELFFYLSFPLLLVGIKRIPGRYLWPAAAGVAAVVAVMPLVAELIQGGVMFPPPVSVSFPRFWFVYAFPPVRMLEFVLGMLMARIVLSGRWIPLGRLPALALAIGAFVGLKHASTLFSIVAVMVVPIALLISSVAAADVRGARSWLGSRFVVRLGEISFAFYLLHQLVLSYGHRWLGLHRTWSTPGAFGVLAALLVVALALSAVLHAVVEQPAMARFARPRRRPAPIEPAAEPDSRGGPGAGSDSGGGTGSASDPRGGPGAGSSEQRSTLPAANASSARGEPSTVD